MFVNDTQLNSVQQDSDKDYRIPLLWSTITIHHLWEC